MAAFAPIGASKEDALVARDYLASMWAAAGRLGMDGPLVDGVATGFPEIPLSDEPAFRLLAGRSGSDSNGVTQAYVFARHDAVGLCVALASNDDDAGWERWPEQLATWRGEFRGVAWPPQMLGEAYILVGHAEEANDATASLDDQVGRVAALTSLGITPGPFFTPDGRAIWSGTDKDGRRVTVVISPPELEEDLSRWLWWQGTHEAAPFVIYLLDAAKLEYERRVYQVRRRAITASLAGLDSDLDGVLTLHAHGGLAGRTSMPGLIDAQERLIGARAASSSLVIDLTFLRALKRTAAIARRNLAARTPESMTPVTGRGTTSIFERDQRVATWLEEQVDQDLGYAEAVLQRAGEAQELTRLRLDQSMTRVSRAQSRVTLMQTSLVSSLVSGLGAIAIMDLSFDPDINLRLPLLLAFMATTAFLPVLAAHWFERYGIVDHVVAILLGGSIGWLALQLGAVATGSGHPGLSVVVLAAVGGAAVGRVLTWVHDRGPLPGERRADSKS